MRFSEVFNLDVDGSQEWFDPLLSKDTSLFIDPFLIYSHETGNFTDAHAKVIQFFDSVFRLVADSDSPSHTSYRSALRNLILPEVSEVCLGYTGLSTEGAGSGRGIARVLAIAIRNVINAGLTDLDHFETIELFGLGIGADRISDAVANILRSNIASYTAQICEDLGVEMHAVRYPHGQYDLDMNRWIPINCTLPINPYSRHPVLLLPKRYLNTLPTINSHDFFDYAYDSVNALLREEFGDDVKKRVSKEQIIELALKHPTVVQDYISNVEGQSVSAYNLLTDPLSLTSWWEYAKSFVASRQVVLAPRNLEEMKEAAREIINEYKHNIEQENGYRILWDDSLTKPRKETIAQDLFYAIAVQICRYSNIDLSREVYAGRGIVDFKLSRSRQLRVLLEVKLASNTKFWNNLRSQLPAYLIGDRVDVGFYIIILHREEDLTKISGYEDIIRQRAAETDKDLNAIVINAMPGSAAPSA